MSRNSKDYQNGKNYCIRNNFDLETYVGSTTQPLCKRMAKHRTNTMSTKLMNIKLYVKMREHGLDNFYIELIEDCPCETLEQLRKREGHYIREMGTLNHRIECRTSQEYRDANKDKIKDKNKENKDANKDKLKDYRKEYNEANKDKTKDYSKEYYDANKDKKKNIKKQIKIN